MDLSKPFDSLYYIILLFIYVIIMPLRQTIYIASQSIHLMVNNSYVQKILNSGTITHHMWCSTGIHKWTTLRLINVNVLAFHFEEDRTTVPIKPQHCLCRARIASLNALGRKITLQYNICHNFCRNKARLLT